MLGEVRKVTGRQLAKKRGRELRDVLLAAHGVGAGRMAELPHREAEDVTVERVVGRVREFRREAGLP